MTLKDDYVDEKVEFFKKRVLLVSHGLTDQCVRTSYNRRNDTDKTI